MYPSSSWAREKTNRTKKLILFSTFFYLETRGCCLFPNLSLSISDQLSALKGLGAKEMGGYVYLTFAFLIYNGFYWAVLIMP